MFITLASCIVLMSCVSGFQRTDRGYLCFDETGVKPNTGFVVTPRSIFSEPTGESFKASFVSTSTAEEELRFGRRLMKIYTQGFVECSLKLCIFFFTGSVTAIIAFVWLIH